MCTLEIFLTYTRGTRRTLFVESCDFMMSIITQERVHFSNYLLNQKLFGHETWRTNRYIHG